MRWNRKGHELEMQKEEIISRLGMNSKIFVFGAGKIGKHVAGLFQKYGCFAGFIDNNKQLQDDIILSLEEYLEKGREMPIVVAVTEKYKVEIVNQLQRVGKKENRDFFFFDSFLSKVFPIMSIAIWNKSFVRLAQISLTERCTLKCKNCAHGCFAVSKDMTDLKLETVIESVDYFFRIVDYIDELVLIGGEPFLYCELDEAIKYISEKYSDKINRLSITTNGTLTPRKQVLESIKKHDVFIHISNYSRTLPTLSGQYERLVKILDNFNIDYSLGKADFTWIDYGFGNFYRNAEEDELIRVFDQCSTPCREIRGKRYYYCVMARAVSDNLGLGVGLEDYLDLELISELNDKEIFEEYELGYSEKGYLDMCNYCRGKDAQKYPVRAAEQM